MMNFKEMSKPELIEAMSKYIKPELAAKQSTGFMIAFLEVRAQEEGRAMWMSGSAGLSAGAPNRRRGRSNERNER